MSKWWNGDGTTSSGNSQWTTPGPTPYTSTLREYFENEKPTKRVDPWNPDHVVAFRWLKMWFAYAVCVGTQAILPMTIGLGIYLLFTNQPWWVLLGVQIIVAPIGVLASIMAATAAWLKVSRQRRLRRANSRTGQDH